jgi:hypothetical protein
VERKRWNATGMNTRDSHAALSGAVVAIEKKFDVGDEEADHPLDARLSPKEKVNCHCWMTPVVDEAFETEELWTGR